MSLETHEERSAAAQRSHSLRDLRLRTGWKPGPAAKSAGPLLISYTEFTPHTLRDLPAIYFAAERLRAACAGLEGAVGVTTYWQLFRGRAPLALHR